MASDEILGSWQWRESTGGFAGWTITPRTEGFQKSLQITDATFEMFQDDSLLLSGSYSMGKLNYSLFENGDSTYIEVEAGNIWGIQWDQKNLYLMDLCDDCYLHTYKRK